MATCFMCNTDYKVSEFHGKTVCHGFCRRKLENQIGKGPAGDAPAPAAAESPQQRAPVQRTPSWKAGDCCRAACPDADHELLEAVIKAVSPDGSKAKVTFVGMGESTYKVKMKDLAPSRGKGARDKQAAVTESGDHDQTTWKVGDKCIATFSEDGVEYKAEIESIEGRNCVVKYIEYGNSEKKPLSELKPMPAKPKVGDIVRAVYSEDGNEYEAEITFIGESEGHEYATVKFVDYGNEDTVWLNEVKPSQAKEAVQTPTAAEVEEPLKEASEPTPTAEPSEVPLTSETSATPAPAASEVKSWQVGDFCRAVFSEDGNEYEGKVTSIGESEGHNYYVVEFLGYGNEESVWEDGMMSSQGPEERKAQLAVCGMEPEEVQEAAAEAPAEVASGVVEPVTDPIQAAPGEVKTVADADSTVESPSTKGAKKEWQVGQPCRAVFAEDGAEYEADLTAIQTEACGNKSATVVFVGYGNTEQVWLEELLESNAEERQAVMESFGLVAAAAQVDDSPSAAPTSTQETDSVAPTSAQESTAAPTSTQDAVASPKEEPANEPVKSTAIVTKHDPAGDKENVKTGDFCRVVYQGSDRPDLCGTELEGMVFSVDGDKTTVRILGVHSVYQKVPTAGGLKGTGGSGKREEQIMRFRNEKTTPTRREQPATTMPSLSPLATGITDVNQGFATIHELVNKLSSELDLKGCNQDLTKRVRSLEAANQALVEQNDVIRSGNMNLLQQLQTNSKAVEQNGKITDSQYQDTMKVFAKNLEYEKNRFEEMERKYTHTIETNAADGKALLAKIEGLKQENQRMKRENLLIKQEKQELVNEVITLKARLVQ